MSHFEELAAELMQSTLQPWSVFTSLQTLKKNCESVSIAIMVIYFCCESQLKTQTYVASLSLRRIGCGQLHSTYVPPTCRYVRLLQHNVQFNM